MPVLELGQNPASGLPSPFSNQSDPTSLQGLGYNPGILSCPVLPLTPEIHCYNQ